MFQDKFGLGVSSIVRKMTKGFSDCSVGLTYVGLTASSDLLPCVPTPIKLGSFLEQSLREIWVGNKLLNYIRNRKALKGACKICAHRELCGGCRYTAYIAHGDCWGQSSLAPSDQPQKQADYCQQISFLK